MHNKLKKLKFIFIANSLYIISAFKIIKNPLGIIHKRIIFLMAFIVIPIYNSMQEDKFVG